MKKRASMVVSALAALLMICSVKSYAMSVETTDLTTGEVTIEEIPEEFDSSIALDGFEGILPGMELMEPVLPGTGIGINKIIGTDDRVVINNPNVLTFRSIGLLENHYNGASSYSVGTAFLVGPHTVLTAAHCVYDPNEGSVGDSIIFIPAKNGSIEPYGQFTVQSAHVPSGYITALANGNFAQKRKYDFAVLELSSNIGNQLGYLALGGTGTSYNATFLNGKTVKIAGYPQSPNIISGKMYKHAETVIGFANDTCDMRYTVDTEPGQSGSPVMYYNSNTSKYYVVGIHTHAGASNENYNIGRYMGSAVKSMVQQYQ